MNTTDTAHAILATARDVYERTGWCKRALVTTEGERCLNGVLAVGITQHVATKINDEHYPSDLWHAANTDGKTAIELAMDHLRSALADHPWAWTTSEDERTFQREVRHPMDGDVGSIENLIIGWNDEPARTSEDILLALDKAVANT